MLFTDMRGSGMRKKLATPLPKLSDIFTFMAWMPAGAMANSSEPVSASYCHIPMSGVYSMPLTVTLSMVRPVRDSSATSSVARVILVDAAVTGRDTLPLPATSPRTSLTVLLKSKAASADSFSTV